MRQRKDESQKHLTKISKQIAYLLRHCQSPRIIVLNGGWAEAETVIGIVGRSHPGFSREELDRIVMTDSKGRYAYDASSKRIRANQGHSIPGVVIEMESPAPPDLLYHGTAKETVPLILREGIKSMERNWVHLSSTPSLALTVGTRHGEPVILSVRARDFVADGYSLFCSKNGVWQASYVPPQYVSVLILNSDEKD